MRRLNSLTWALALVLAAFALRVFRLDYQGLWYDEAFSVYLAHFSWGEITARTAADIQPPLYYYLLHFWILLVGDSEFALRFLSLFFGVLTIPLIYALAHQLFAARAARIAALIATLSPLYLWYAQEARMYTLITFLLLLSSYWLLRALASSPDGRAAFGVRDGAGLGESRRARPPTALRKLRSVPDYKLYWSAFALTNVAAIYTHYFAFVVIGFQLLYALYCFTQRATRNPLSALRATLYAFFTILIAFLLWLPNVLARFGQDASYWRGMLKLDEALRHIFINFTTGESVLEAQAQWLAVGWLVSLLVGLLARCFVRHSNDPTDKQRNDATSFLILYLIIPLALLLLLFSRNPKFNPRYLMIASPPFFILLGAGLARLLAIFQRAQTRARGWAGVLLLSAIGYLLSTALYADWNLYADPAFTKADFRKIARYIEQNAARDDAIVLTSGHLFPAFNYYYRGDLPQIRLPDEPTLNTARVIGYDAAYVLNQHVAGQRGVWAVLWQDEVVDPNGFLPLFFATRGKEQKVSAAFYQVKLRYWTLVPDAHFATAPEVAMPRRANFKNQVELLGITPNPTPADTGASFFLFWNVLADLEEDYQVALRVRDAQGNTWGKLDRRPAGYNYPTPRWKKGEQLFGAYSVPLLPGTPAGEYFVEATFYAAQNPSGLDVLAPNGAPLGKSVKLGPISVLPATTPPTLASLNIPNTLSAPLGPFTLLGYQLGRDKASAGESIPLTLFWRVESKLEREHSFRIQFGDALSDNYQLPITNYQINAIARTQYQIAIPANARAGVTTLRVLLSDGNSIALAPFMVEQTDRVFVKPNAPVAQGANFANSIALIGYQLPITIYKPTDTLQFTLYWHARAKMDKPYTLFVHLLDKDSKVVAQKDAQPLNGARPTQTWVAGEYLGDNYQLPLTLPPGEYRIEIGWYDASDPQFARLQVMDDNGAAVGDHVILKISLFVQ